MTQKLIYDLHFSKLSLKMVFDKFISDGDIK